MPPLTAIDVDITADVAEMIENGYLFKKNRKLLIGPAPRFGVEKMNWILTDAQTVTIATRERIESVDWSRDVDLMDGHSFNIGAYPAKRGLIVE